MSHTQVTSHDELSALEPRKCGHQRTHGAVLPVVPRPGWERPTRLHANDYFVAGSPITGIASPRPPAPPPAELDQLPAYWSPDHRHDEGRRAGTGRDDYDFAAGGPHTPDCCDRRRCRQAGDRGVAAGDKAGATRLGDAWHRRKKVRTIRLGDAWHWRRTARLEVRARARARSHQKAERRLASIRSSTVSQV
jgi:hypothetical protein